MDPIFSLFSLHSCDSRLVLPEPVRPMQTKSYSGRGGGGTLQQSARKHCWRRNKKAKVNHSREALAKKYHDRALLTVLKRTTPLNHIYHQYIMFQTHPVFAI